MLSSLGHVLCLIFRVPISSVSNLESLVSWCNKWLCIDPAVIAPWWLHHALANMVLFTMTLQSLSYVYSILRTQICHFSFCQFAAWQGSDLWGSWWWFEHPEGCWTIFVEKFPRVTSSHWSHESSVKWAQPYGTLFFNATSGSVLPLLRCLAPGTSIPVSASLPVFSLLILPSLHKCHDSIFRHDI